MMDPRSSACVIGVDIGGTYTRIRIADQEGRALADARMRSEAEHNGERLLTRLIEAIDEALQRAQADFRSLRSMVIGTPSVVDPHTQHQSCSVNLPGWDEVNLYERMSKRYQVPVLIENDANLAALGELEYGAGRPYQDFVLIQVGTGVGAAIVVGRELVRGKGGAAGEIALMLLDREATLDQYRPHGFLESVASGAGIESRVEALRSQFPASSLGSSGNTSAATVFEHYQRGDPLAKHVIDEAIKYLGFAAVNVAALLAPEAIIFGGGVVTRQPFIVDEIRKIVLKHTFVAPEVLRSELDDEGGVQGAVIRALTMM